MKHALDRTLWPVIQSFLKVSVASNGCDWLLAGEKEVYIHCYYWLETARHVPHHILQAS